MHDVFRDFLDIATEAPTDITANVQEQLQSMSDNSDPDGGDIDNSGDIDTDIDNLVNDETEGEDTEDYEDEDENLEDTDTEELEDDSSEDEDLEEDEEETVEEDGDYDKKVRIHKNTINFLDIISSNRDSFENRFSKTLTPEEIKDYHTIIKAFDNLIEMTESYLCTKFIDGTYVKIIKTYVALTRVYDLILRMVEVFVKTHIEEKNKN